MYLFSSVFITLFHLLEFSKLVELLYKIYDQSNNMAGNISCAIVKLSADGCLRESAPCTFFSEFLLRPAPGCFVEKEFFFKFFYNAFGFVNSQCFICF